MDCRSDAALPSVEATFKTIVNGRLKRSGMRWSQDGGKHVLNLRTAVKSNR